MFFLFRKEHSAEGRAIFRILVTAKQFSKRNQTSNKTDVPKSSFRLFYRFEFYISSCIHGYYT